MSPFGQPLADPWMRVLARFLDGVILAVIANLLLPSLLDIKTANGVGWQAGGGKLIVYLALALAIGFVWDPLLTKMTGGTPMKLAFGMRVVRADTGGRIEWKHAVLRWLVPGAIGVIPCLGALVGLVVVIVSLVFIFTKPLRQAVWDNIAGTLVTKGKRG
jgi:uncharacterized RDD family membrane protein YckC